MSTSTITSPGALTPFATVAHAAGLEAWALQRLEQSRFRSPENFREIHGRPFLTVAGIRELARVLKAHGYASKEHALTVLANQVEQTPSRSLAPAAPKSSEPFDWQRRKDLA